MKPKIANRDKSIWFAAGLGLAVLAGLNDAQAQEKNDRKEKQAKPAARANQQQPQFGNDLLKISESTDLGKTHHAKIQIAQRSNPRLNGAES